MNLTRVCRFVAASASLALSGHVLCAACAAPQLTPSERLARVKDLDQAAHSDMEQRRFIEAVKKFREAACLAPDSSRVLYGLGVAEAASGDFIAARDSLRTADRLQPATPLPLVMQVRVNFALHDIDSLKSNLREAAVRFARDGELHGVLARFLIENKLFALALAESLRAKEARAGDVSAKVELAGLENTVGAYDEAIRNATEVEAQAGVPDVVRSAAAGIAGLSYESSADHPEAVRHLQESIRLDPTRENSYLALANILEKAQQPAGAVKILEQGRRSIPRSTAFLLPLGINLVRAEQYKAAIPILREAIQHAPDEDQAYLNIAAAARNSGDTALEIQILRDLEQRSPKYPEIHVLIARALLNADPVDYRKIREEIAAAEKIQPADPDLFYLKGKVAAATNQEADAAAAYERTIELRPMDPSAYYQLGRVYQKLGRSELAQQQMERAVMLGGSKSGR